MATKEQLLELVSTVAELNNISKEMNDPVVDEALGIIIRMTVRQDIAPGAAAMLVVRTAALAAQFKMKAKNYMLFDKSSLTAQRKNVYMSLHDEMCRLSDAVKYLAKGL